MLVLIPEQWIYLEFKSIGHYCNKVPQADCIIEKEG